MDDLTFKPIKHNHEEFLREEMKDEEFRKGYEALGPKYALIRQLLLARQNSGLTQEAIAHKIGTTKSAISRLESGGKHVPSITTLRKYADAVGCELEIKLIKKNRTPYEAKPISVQLSINMKINYYPDTDSLYIEFSEKESSDSIEISEGIVLDYDQEGTLVGMDIDNAKKKVGAPSVVSTRSPCLLLTGDVPFFNE